MYRIYVRVDSLNLISLNRGSDSHHEYFCHVLINCKERKTWQCLIFTIVHWTQFSAKQNVQGSFSLICFRSMIATPGRCDTGRREPGTPATPKRGKFGL